MLELDLEIPIYRKSIKFYITKCLQSDSLGLGASFKKNSRNLVVSRSSHNNFSVK